jgi:hypothetical protein
MDRGHREYLERRHNAREWHGRDSPNRRVISDFHFSGSELTGWTLLRTRRDARHTPPTLLTLWHRGDPTLELLAIDVWECVSAVAAHDQLLEVLGSVQSDAVERHKARTRIGDVAFTLGHTFALFGRVNIVVMIRNAGPKTLDVEPVARVVDDLLVSLSPSGKSPRRR